MDSKTIFIAEDDANLIQVLKVKLEFSGFNFLSAIDGEEAIKILSSNKPDLILLDIMLPKRSGFDILDFIKKNDELKNIPVIMISNLGNEKDIARSREMGVNEYLIKADYSLAQIIDKIKEHLVK